MKLIEFGSSRVKVYENGKMINYQPFNLLGCDIDLIDNKITNLLDEVGEPDKSFFTEWVRGENEIISYLKKNDRLGEIKILSEEEEAELFVKTVKREFSIEAVICDSGGGSVQISIPNGFSKSFKIGSIFIEKEIIGHGIPYSEDEIQKIKQYITNELNILPNDIGTENLICGSTQVESFFKSLFIKELSHKKYVTPSELNEGIAKLMFKKYEEIVDIFPEPKGYMYGTLILLITIYIISIKTKTSKIYPTNLNWMKFFL